MSEAENALFLDRWARHRPPTATLVLRTLLVAAAYAATGYLGLRLSFIGGSVTLFWPPSGIAFAALWIGGNRYLPAIGLGAVAVNLVTGLPLPLAVLVAIGNGLSAWTGVLVVRRLLDRRPSAGELTRVVSFILVPALGCTLISATIGTIAVGILYPLGSSVQATWLVWWMGDAMGVLIVAPPILLWRRLIAAQVRWRDVRDVFGFALGGVLIIVGLRLIHQPIWAVELCKLFTLLLSLWAGARFGLNGPAAMTLLMAAGAVGVTAAGTGPFVYGSFYDSFALVHSYLFAEAVAGMLLAAAIADLRRALLGKHMALQQVAAASDNRIQLLTMISHDVRTPLSAVMGVLQTLQRSDLPREQVRLLGLGLRASDTITALVTDILDVARLDGGTVTLNDHPFDPVRSLRDIIEINRPAAVERGLELRTVLDPSLPGHVVGDRVRFEQLIGNLVTNAVTYTIAGHVTVKAKWAGSLVVTVADTGPGIATEFEPHIFDAFVRGADRLGTGLGLGLQICQQLAALMGGTIRFHPGVPDGSCFTVELPLPRHDVPERLTGLSPLEDCRLAILLVEDDEIAREVTAALLGSHGHHVTLAEGADVPALLRERSFDLILMDIVGRDGMASGLDATRAIRAMPAPAGHIPIMALTGDGVIENHRTYIAAGMDGVLVKPLFTGQGIAALVREARVEARRLVAQGRD